MYRDITTICWSIKQVNKNLSDRPQLSDYSIKYLKQACMDLAGLMLYVEKCRPGISISVTDKTGATRETALKEIAGMLEDAKKIVEFNLIDSIDSWAREGLEHEESPCGCS